MILYKKRITKVLIRLRGCAGCSAPVLFANPRKQVFSRRGLIKSEMTQWELRGILLSKAFTCMNFTCINKMAFYQRDGYLGPIVVKTIFTSHTDHFKPQHIAFEQSAACLSDVLSHFLVLLRLQYCGILIKMLTWTRTTVIELQYIKVFWPKCMNMYIWYYLQFLIYTMNIQKQIL